MELSPRYKFMTYAIMNFNRSATFTAAARRMLFAFYPDLDNIGSSANSRIDDNGLRRTVSHAGSTFHACIEINEMGPLITHFKN